MGIDHTISRSRWAALTSVLLIACSATAPSSTAIVILRGSVTKSGAAASGLPVHATSAPTTQCAAGDPGLIASVQAQTNASGDYIVTVPSTASGERCITVAVLLTAADSVMKSGVFATFRTTAPPDTVTVNFDVP